MSEQSRLRRGLGAAKRGFGRGAKVVGVLRSPTKFVKSAIESMASPEQRPAYFTAGAAGALVLGRKAMAFGLMAQAARDYEAALLADDPERSGKLRDRLESALERYQARHTHPATRIVHVVSLPLLAGGAVGMLASRPLFPLWNVAVGAFGVGCAMNLGTQVILEDAPLLVGGDPLALTVGPIWDLFHLGQVFVSDEET